MISNIKIPQFPNLESESDSEQRRLRDSANSYGDRKYPGSKSWYLPSSPASRREYEHREWPTPIRRDTTKSLTYDILEELNWRYPRLYFESFVWRCGCAICVLLVSLLSLPSDSAVLDLCNCDSSVSQLLFLYAVGMESCCSCVSAEFVILVWGLIRVYVHLSPFLCPFFHATTCHLSLVLYSVLCRQLSILPLVSS